MNTELDHDGGMKVPEKLASPFMDIIKEEYVVGYGKSVILPKGMKYHAAAGLVEDLVDAATKVLSAVGDYTDLDNYKTKATTVPSEDLRLLLDATMGVKASLLSRKTAAEREELKRRLAIEDAKGVHTVNERRTLRGLPLWPSPEGDQIVKAGEPLPMTYSEERTNKSEVSKAVFRFEGSVDGIVWFNLAAGNVHTGAVSLPESFITGHPDEWKPEASGFNWVRCNIIQSPATEAKSASPQAESGQVILSAGKIARIIEVPNHLFKFVKKGPISGKEMLDALEECDTPAVVEPEKHQDS